MDEKELREAVRETIKALGYEKKKVLTSQEAAGLLGMSLGQLYKLTCERRIPYYKAPGGKYNYFDKDEIEAWALSIRKPTKAELDGKASGGKE